MMQSVNYETQYQSLLEEFKQSISDPSKAEASKPIISTILTSYYPTYVFFDAWISNLPSTDIEQCLNNILKFLPKFELVMRCLDKALESYENELLECKQIRDMFELSVKKVGFDVFESSTLWKKYIDFEIDEYEEILEISQDPKAISLQKEKFIKLFHRQLSLPLVGNENTLNQMDQLLSEYCTETDLDIIKPDLLTKKFQDSLTDRENRLTYEIHLHSERYQNLSPEEKISSWKTYIKFENDERQLFRLERLYERAILEFPDNLELWLNYSFNTLTSSKNWSLSLEITSRGLKRFYQSSWLYRIQLYAIENLNLPYEETIIKLKESMTQAFTYGFKDYSDYLNEMISYLNCIRRISLLHFDKSISINQLNKEVFLVQLEDIKSTVTTICQESENLFLAYFSSWEAGVWKFYKAFADIENNLLFPINDVLKSLQKVTDNQLELADFINHKSNNLNNQKKYVKRNYISWENASKSLGKNWWYWQSSIQWYIGKGEIEEARAIFRRSFHLNLDITKETLGQEWLLFEEEYGDMNSLITAFSKTFPYQISTILSQINIQTISNVEIPNELKKNKRQRQEDSTEESLSKDPKRVKQESEHQLTSEIPQTPSIVNKLMIKNFPFATDLQTIINFMVSENIKYQNVECLNSKIGNFRGIIIMDFCNSEDKENALKLLTNKEYEGRLLEVDQNVILPKQREAEAIGDNNMIQKTTIFVNHLTPEITDDDIKAHFASCGNIIAAKVAIDKKTGLSKCNALIEFETEEARNKALKLNKSDIQGNKISVMASKFTIQQPSRATPAIDNLDEKVALPEISNNHIEIKPKTIITSATMFKPRGVMKPRVQI